MNPETAAQPRSATSMRASGFAASGGLRLRRVSKTWPGTDGPVLDNISLWARPGATTWIGGINGAGKTTLLRLAAGILSPDQGDIRLGDLDPERDRRQYHRRIGFLSAGDRGLIARLSARRQLSIWASMTFIPRVARGRAVQAAVEEFGLGAFQHRRVERLSLGQRQRVRLALAFMHAPDIVLLDEPATSLDAEGIDVLHAAADRVLDRGGSVVWCSPPAEEPVLASSAAYRLRGNRLESC